MARTADKRFMVIDGKEEKPYESVGQGTFLFSPDSARVAYMAKEAAKPYPFVVVDGRGRKRV